MLASLPCAPPAGAAEAPPTVYAAGDIADCRHSRPAYSGAARTAAVIEAGLARDGGAVVLSLGDHSYPEGGAAEFQNCYQPTWGRFKDRTWPAPGNHEYATPGAGGYFDYFGARAGPGRRGYYSVDLGAWHIVSLNSDLHGAADAAQLLWLKDDLARHRRRCTLAYWHAPLYSSGGHAASTHMRAAWQTLYAAGADVVLSGHDHDYERFAPQDADGRLDAAHGLRQFVAGTGGAFLTPMRFARPNSEARDNSHHGVLRLVLKDEGYTWDFLAADDGGAVPDTPPPEFHDSGAAGCH
ncbi:metallophosphoesterase [Rugamonas sp.]|uniref:metallophosphoesterase family protein n=1 Tax=Rugamonas sp. TaxID=1926287 RepID=UPI0025E5418E|nr:metallophosphoesterase [Rugamonas sp.]